MDLQELSYQQHLLNWLRKMRFFLHVRKTPAVPDKTACPARKYANQNAFNMSSVLFRIKTFLTTYITSLLNSYSVMLTQKCDDTC